MTKIIQPMIVMSSKKESFVTEDGTLLHLCSTNIDDAVGHIIPVDMARNGKDTNEVDLLRASSTTQEDSIISLHEILVSFKLKLHSHGSSGGSITVAFIHESLKPSSTHVDDSYRVEGICEITFTKHLLKCADWFRYL